MLFSLILFEAQTEKCFVINQKNLFLNALKNAMKATSM